jgi:3D (Asp-Asp-Asp) domain-containing protein
MKQSTRNRGAGVLPAQALLWSGGYLVAAAVVCWSAVAAKQSHMVPALVAIDTLRVEASSKPAPSEAVITPVATIPEASMVEPLPVVESQPERVELELSEFESKFADRIDPVASGSDEIRYFNGRPVRPVKTYWMTVTAYSPDERSCGKWADGITASNKSVWTNAMQLVAADTRLLPFGSLLTIEGYADNQIVPVEDRGGAIKGMRLDLLYATHREALQWGVQRMPVTVWEYIDG